MKETMLILPEYFGKVIKHARKGKGLTQRQVAEKCGIVSAYLTIIENDTSRIPSFKLCAKLAAALDLDLKSTILWAWWFKTKPEYRKYLSFNLDPFYNVDNETKEILDSYPELKPLFIALSKLNLEKEPIKEIVRLNFNYLINALRLLKRQPDNLQIPPPLG